ncbi:hypothetical protein megetsur_10 [Escherichia phage megetsur]|nr:hypothetical protein megetsur_10 [Escherichia phage megetsur]
MAKEVTVRYTGVHTSAHSKFCARDCTIGELYAARLPELGEVDPDGLEVCLPNELWVDDDAGDTVVTQLGDGFELVE